ncbi:Os12g0468900, partial [Oryza sativa Japonica Group]
NATPSLRSIALAPSRGLPWSLATSPPSPSLSRAAGRLQPPLPPCPCAGRPRRRLLQRRRHLLHPGLPSVSRGDPRSCLPAVALLFPPCWPPPAAPPASPVHPPAAPPPLPASQLPPLSRLRLRFAGKSPETRPHRRLVVSPPLHHLQPSLPPRLSVGRRRRLLPRRRRIALHPGCSSVSPERRRRAGLSILFVAGVLSAAPSSSPARRLAAPLPPPASQPQGRPRHRFPSIQTPPRSIIVVSDRSRRRRPVGRPARRLAAPPPSSSSQRRVPRRPRPRAAAAGCPRRLLAGPGRRRRRRPLVVPGRRGVRPSVEPFSSVVRVRQVSRRSPVIVFVLGSASSSLVPAASRLRPRIAAEVVPSPRRVVACSFACVLRVAFVVPEVPEAWFVVVAEGSEGRSL